MLSFFSRGVLDEILNLTESVSEEFPSYFMWTQCFESLQKQRASFYIHETSLNNSSPFCCYLYTPANFVCAGGGGGGEGGGCILFSRFPSVCP